MQPLCPTFNNITARPAKVACTTNDSSARQIKDTMKQPLLSDVVHSIISHHRIGSVQ